MKTSIITKSKAKTKAMLIGDNHARRAVAGLTKNDRATGLTNGTFSLISLIRALLDITGEANIIISTWSAGIYDSTAVNDLINCGKLKTVKLILDRSFKTRQKKYSTYMTDLFQPENIRTTDTHAKFVLIWNDEWNICIRSSMNLNENKRCEHYDIDNDIDIFNLFKDFSDNLFKQMPEGIIEDRRIVDPVFNSLFHNEDFEQQPEDIPIVDSIDYDSIFK